MRRRRRRTALIKSNNPHLAGGEKRKTKLTDVFRHNRSRLIGNICIYIYIYMNQLVFPVTTG